MAAITPPIDLKKLAEPFAPEQVSWRIAQAGKKKDGTIWAKLLCYIDSRAVMDRLDAVCGPGNWQNEYREWGGGKAVICGISIRQDEAYGDREYTDWVTKWDGAGNTDIESVKGGLSDSFKRAAVQWGIGRDLYNYGESFAEISDKPFPGSRYANVKIKVNGSEEWVQFNWSPPTSFTAKVGKPKVEKRKYVKPPQPVPATAGAAEAIAAVLPDAVVTKDVDPPSNERFLLAQAAINSLDKAGNAKAIFQAIDVYVKKGELSQDQAMDLSNALKAKIESFS